MRGSIMSKAILAIVGGLTLLSASASRAQTPAPGTAESRREPVVVTMGTAVLQRPPDRAFVQIGAEARAVSPRDAQAQNARTMTAVRERLRALGISDQSIETRAVELVPEFDFVSGRQKLRGYLARNVIQVTVDDVARVGEIIDAAVGAGATLIHDVRFDVKDRSAVEREALRSAVADAMGRAQALAAGAGKTVDRVVTIEEHRQDHVPIPRPMMAARSEAMQMETPIAPGQIEIRASVTLTAAIK
jgi:uncharacterized protein YggE